MFGIVRAHQGAIQVASAPGQGTTITLLLPTSVQPFPVIVASGYSAQEARERLGETPVRAVLQKPFRVADLQQVLQDCLDGAAGSSR